MGKIFDALEKAGSQTSVPRPLTEKATVSRNKEDDVGNLVALTNATRTDGHFKMDSHLVTFHNPNSIEAEIFKVLRTNILFPKQGKPPRIILITSALPGDGKSFVAANFAISIAKGLEEYVMLIDCDVRRPTIHKLFGYGQVDGLSEHLASGTDLKKLLLKSPVPKLTILASGRPPQNPTELLSSKRMKAFLNEAVSRYDDRFIIIDSPPPSVAAETGAIINLVDSVIVVVKSGKTPKAAVNETIEQIGKEKIIGVVLNHSDQGLKKYYDYKKSYGYDL